LNLPADDGPAELYRKRCAEYRNTLPALPPRQTALIYAFIPQIGAVI
jgi:hypothetical protein